MNPTGAKTKEQPSGHQAPSIGRTVLFCYASPVRYTLKGEQLVITQSPAIIQRVNTDGTCLLAVLGPRATFGAGGYELVESVSLGLTAEPTPGTWMWPRLV
jgi:hypothetical protein